MASKKQILERLAEIKNRAAGLAADAQEPATRTAANLAEEAAGLGIELAALLDAKGK